MLFGFDLLFFRFFLLLLIWLTDGFCLAFFYSFIFPFRFVFVILITCGCYGGGRLLLLLLLRTYIIRCWSLSLPFSGPIVRSLSGRCHIISSAIRACSICWTLTDGTLCILLNDLFVFFISYYYSISFSLISELSWNENWAEATNGFGKNIC